MGAITHTVADVELVQAQHAADLAAATRKQEWLERLTAPPEVTGPAHALYKVAPEVRLELERIHHGNLEIEVPDEMNRARQELLGAGWLGSSETMFGAWLEIHPLALVGQKGKQQLRPNRDHKFVMGAGGVQLQKNAGSRS